MQRSCFYKNTHRNVEKALILDGCYYHTSSLFLCHHIDHPVPLSNCENHIHHCPKARPTPLQEDPVGVNTIYAASNLALAILLILHTLPLALQALLIHVIINVIQEVMTDYAQEVIQETKSWWSHC